MKDQLEIERRWILWSLPALDKAYTSYIIHQSYGKDEFGQTFRLRMQFRETGKVAYILTKKTPISPGVMHEDEREITLAEFDELGKKTTHKLSKKRFVHLDNGLHFEVDYFHRIHLLILEVELPSLAYEFLIPEYIQRCIVSEITGNPEFSNHNLAKLSS